MDVLIIDKTVPTSSYREHSGLVWLLNYEHWQNAGRDYSVSDDFAGWHSIDKHRRRTKPVIWPILPADYDLIYLTDTYGVYQDHPEDDYHKATREKIIYGGLTNDDVNKVEKQLRPNGTLVVEFNSFADPTTPAVRERMSKIVGVEWTGWIGRHFENLDIKSIEVPQWMPGQYQAHTGRKWNFHGKGFVFVKETGEIVVLKDKTEVKTNGLRIRFSQEARAKYHVTNNIPYDYWFDIMTTRPNGHTLAKYHFNLTKQGQYMLDYAGIPATFPAVVRTDSDRKTSYYFAGDWVDKKGLPTKDHIWQIGLNQYRYDTDFYWHVYAPLMEQIMNDTYRSQHEKF